VPFPYNFQPAPAKSLAWGKWHRNFLQKNSRNLRIVQLEILEIPGRKIKWIGKSQYIILLAKRNFTSTDIY